MNKNVMILMCVGTRDPFVSVRLEGSMQKLTDTGVDTKNVEMKEYPMGHSICGQEVKDISKVPSCP